MKRFAVAVGALAALTLAGCAAYVQGVIPGTSGCTLRSVDEQAYVARNEAVFRTIPLPSRLRDAYSTTWTHAVPASHKCLPLENSPPYSGFITTRVYLGSHLGFDERVLHGSWTLQAFTVDMSTYRRGNALLSVTETREGVHLAVDHRAYGDTSD